MPNIYESTTEERELLDNKLVESKKKVPFLQSEDWIVLSYVLKDETRQAIAGINAMLYRPLETLRDRANLQDRL